MKEKQSVSWLSGRDLEDVQLMPVIYPPQHLSRSDHNSRITLDMKDNGFSLCASLTLVET